MDFVTIYIREAHASDEWKLGNIVSIPQHKTIEDRLEAARAFVKDYGWSGMVVVDTMSNELDDTFAIWPERYVVVDKTGCISHISEPHSFRGYNHQTLESHIKYVLQPVETPSVMEMLRP